jgi:hypothetical protein
MHEKVLFLDFDGVLHPTLAQPSALFIHGARLAAYPAQTGRSSHRKLISDPTANWTVIPGQPDHFGA